MISVYDNLYLENVDVITLRIFNPFHNSCASIIDFAPVIDIDWSYCRPVLVLEVAKAVWVMMMMLTTIMMTMEAPISFLMLSYTLLA